MCLSWSMKTTDTCVFTRIERVCSKGTSAVFSVTSESCLYSWGALLVTLSAAKGLARGAEMLRCAQGDSGVGLLLLRSGYCFAKLARSAQGDSGVSLLLLRSGYCFAKLARSAQHDSGVSLLLLV